MKITGLDFFSPHNSKCVFTSFMCDFQILIKTLQPCTSYLAGASVLHPWHFL